MIAVLIFNVSVNAKIHVKAFDNKIEKYNQNSFADQLYANAFNAVQGAIESKTQKSVNAARTAIEALRGTDAEWAIGEFSKQVDTVQHPILVKAYSAVLDAQIYKTQLYINKAKEAIDIDMPLIWRGSYSSAVDKVQQELMQKAVAKYDVAVFTSKISDRDIALNAMKEIAGAIDTNVRTWAESFIDVINALPCTENGSDISPNGVMIPPPSQVNHLTIDITPIGKNGTIVTPVIPQLSLVDSWRKHGWLTYGGTGIIYHKWFMSNSNVWVQSTVEVAEPYYLNDVVLSKCQTGLEKNYGAYECIYAIDFQTTDPKTSYRELRRLCDSYPVQRIYGDGTEYLFNIPTLTEKQINDFNNATDYSKYYIRGL